MKFDTIILPIIRNTSLAVLASEICAVQPMTEHSSEVFKSSIRYDEPKYKQGALRHVSSRGWQVYYGNEWIPESVWWKIKIAGF